MKTRLLFGMLFLAAVQINAQTNTSVGTNAGTGGSTNVTVGVNAGSNVASPSGTENVYVGYDAGKDNVSGGQNVYVGKDAGSATGSTGSKNTFIGTYTGLGLTSGVANFFGGFNAGRGTTSGGFNIFIGYQSGYQNTTGEYNTFSGFASGSGNTTGIYNLFTGVNAGYNNSTGAYNNFYGNNAGLNVSTGVKNTFIGFESGKGVTTGGYNSILGTTSGLDPALSGTIILADGNNNQRLYIHSNGYAGIGLGNSVIPQNRLEVKHGTANNSGLRLTNLTSASPSSTSNGKVLSVDTNGDVILTDDTNGSGSATAWQLLGNAGTTAGTNFLGTTDNQNLVFKRNNANAGFLGTTTTVFGVTPVNTASTNSVYIGTASGFGVTSAGTHNTFVGWVSGGGSVSASVGNTFLGSESGFNNTSSTTSVATNNTFVGRRAGFSNVQGSNNTFVGRNSGENLTTGSNNVFIGNVTVPNSAATGTSAGNNSSGTIILADGAGNQRVYIHSNGNAGIGLAANTIPNNRLEVSSGTANVSGVRLTNLTRAFVPTVSNTEFLTVDTNGDVVLEKIKNIYTDDGTLEADRTVTMDDRNLVFDTTASTTGGNVYIGSNPTGGLVDTTGDYNLYVEGGILTEKVKVALRSGVDWADYVFADGYKLMPLTEVETFVKANKHLPGVASSDELAKNGLDLSAMQSKQMEKIEELTLHLIEQNKTLDKQAKEIEELKAQMKLLLEKK